jgi:glycosyltransferase involved in cell wall biosynthesis
MAVITHHYTEPAETKRTSVNMEADENQDVRRIVHLTASPFLGGPERQMLGLARSLPANLQTIFWSFSEGGRSRPFLDEARRLGFEAEELDNNAPHFRLVFNELTRRLKEVRPDVLFCHGYKSDLLGGLAARFLKIPVVAVSRGWTGATLKVCINEGLDRLSLLGVDRVVCVSEGQAEKVRRAGVPPRKIRVIRNAISADRFDFPNPRYRQELLGLFAAPPQKIVGAAGRLSPEKGFDILVGAAAEVIRSDPEVGFVIFGEGPLREALQRRIEEEGISQRFLLAPFRSDLDQVIPFFDLVVLSSYTEGLPNIALEASAASVPVVATDVGGIPEVVENGVNGYLVPAGDPCTLAARMQELLDNPPLRETMGRMGRCLIETKFTFESQVDAYTKLLQELRLAPSSTPVKLAAVHSD